MDFQTLTRTNSNWKEEDNPRKRTQSYIDSIQVSAIQHDKQHDGIVSQMYSGISVFCQHVLRNLESSEEARQMEPMSTPLYRLLDSVYNNFITWGDDLQVGSGRLDDALQYSQDLRQFTIQIMIRICETIESELHPIMLEILKATQDCPIQSLEAKLQAIRRIKEDAIKHASLQHDLLDDEYDIYDGDSPGLQSDSSSLEEALEALRDGVEALIDLNPSLEEPIHDVLVVAQEKPAMPPPQETGENSQYQTFFIGIKQKFPKCNDDLAKAISKAIFNLIIRLYEERRAASSTLGVAGSKPKRAVSDLFPNKDSGYETATRDATNEAENPRVEGTIYVCTLHSYTDNNGVTRTPFPSQPKDLEIGQEFPCTACGRHVAKSQTEAAWRRHLLADLRPWICCQVECDCARDPYKTRHEWVKHLQALHEAHPKWNDTECPFCLRTIVTGGRDMIRHVERHLCQLALAALPANLENGNEDSDAEIEPDDAIMNPPQGKVVDDDDDAGASYVSNDPIQQNQADPKSARQRLMDHPLYKNAAQEADGLWHCPWEGEADCDHEPSVLRADHDKFITHHLESLWCKHKNCPSNHNQPFATREILYLHELKEHGMHKGGGRFLCTSPGCGRSREGNGFMNTWLQLEHIKNVHDNIPNLPSPKESALKPVG